MFEKTNKIFVIHVRSSITVLLENGRLLGLDVLLGLGLELRLGLLDGKEGRRANLALCFELGNDVLVAPAHLREHSKQGFLFNFHSHVATATSKQKTNKQTLNIAWTSYLVRETTEARDLAVRLQSRDGERVWHNLAFHLVVRRRHTCARTWRADEQRRHTWTNESDEERPNNPLAFKHLEASQRVHAARRLVRQHATHGAPEHLGRRSQVERTLARVRDALLRHERQIAHCVAASGARAKRNLRWRGKKRASLWRQHAQRGRAESVRRAAQRSRTRRRSLTFVAEDCAR